MDTAFTESQIRSLDTYVAWESARSEQQEAFNVLPWHINQRDRKQLTQQLAYLSIEEAEHQARQLLKEDIASRDDSFLPLTHRLGALAAFDARDVPLDTKKLGEGHWETHGADMFRITRSEQPVVASRDPVALSVQVGDELERLQGLLDTKKPVPVVMVWNNHYPGGRKDYDEIVTGEILDPRAAFVLQQPKVSSRKGISVVEYTLPERLEGVQKGEVIASGMYIEPEEKYKSPALTTLVKLGVVAVSFLRHPPDALYIGKKEVKARLEIAAKQQAYDEEVRARRERQRDRREPYFGRPIA